jgi:hypothetical protein
MLISAKTGLSESARASYACVEPMLRFETPPDKILVAILSSALELQKNYIEELIETETDPMIQWWLAAEPMLARFFDPRTAARLIEGLLAANCDTRLYQLTDYPLACGLPMPESLLRSSQRRGGDRSDRAGRCRPVLHRLD